MTYFQTRDVHLLEKTEPRFVIIHSTDRSFPRVTEIFAASRHRQPECVMQAVGVLKLVHSS